MKQNKISLDMLKEEKEITLNDGQVLSYNFYLSLNEEDNWDVKIMSYTEKKTN